MNQLTRCIIPFLFFAGFSMMPTSGFVGVNREELDWGGSYVSDISGLGRRAVRFEKIRSLEKTDKLIGLNQTPLEDTILIPIPLANAQCVGAFVRPPSEQIMFKTILHRTANGDLRLEGNSGWKRLQPKG